MAIVACAVLCQTSAHVHGVTHLIIPGLLVAYVLGRGVSSLRRDRAAREAREAAWERARSTDAAGTTLARAVTLAAPAGRLLAIAVLCWPHVVGRPERAYSVGFVGPGLVALWLVSAWLWLRDCTDRLVRAAGESDRRLRGYWLRIGSMRAEP